MFRPSLGFAENEHGSITPLKRISKPKASRLPAAGPITVLLAENHTGFRKFVKREIERGGDIKVIGEAKNGRDAVRLARDLQPDVVVMDIGLPLLNGFQATRQILEDFPAIRILILSSYTYPEYRSEAVQRGASGYILKQALPEFLAQAIHEVRAGRTYFT